MLSLKRVLLVWLVWHFGAIAQAATDCNAVTEISPAECTSLLELYHSTDGANWENNEGWNVTNTACSWKGITCENDGVTKIHIWNNQLTGTIPNFTGLPNLQELSLSYNQLTGTIPNFTGLPNLQVLYLRNNQLTGTIPNFTGLPNLQRLYLNENQLTGTIPNFSGLPNLKTLAFYSNQLTGTIPNFIALPNLQSLYLYENQLTGTIPNFIALPNLQSLYLYENQLTGTIPNFTALPNLQALNLWNNQLTGTIPNFSALPNLQALNLWNNQLTGTIPDFSNLPNLQKLYISSNQLTGTIPNFSALPNLQALDLNSNQLTGTIPNFSGLPNLQGLFLPSNQLTGTIPNFSGLPNLQLLYLYENKLTGTIPNFSGLPILEHLYIDSNELTGMIPVSSNTLINLEYLDLRNNPLCKKADYNYAIWPIEQSRWDDETTWEAQLETFPICPLPTETGSDETDTEIVTIDQSAAVLNFIGLKESYQIGEIVDVEIAVNFTAENPADTVDLWIAIQQPSEDFLYMSALPLADLFSPKPQFFREALGTTQETFSVISDFKLPKGVGGNYTFYAALVETGKNPLTEGAWVMRHIVQSRTLLSNR